MSYLEKEYKQGESLYRLKPPTCERYEPNFERIFDFIQNGHMNEKKEVVSPDGTVAASIWDQEQIF